MFANLLSVMLSVAVAILPPDVPTARDLRSLPAADVAAGRSVRITGVVTFAPNPPHYFYLQDGTGGVRVAWPMSDRELRAGDAVEVSGTAARGRFIPEVKATAVRAVKAGPSATAKPQPFSLTPDESYFLDAQWVTVEAVVQRAWVHEGWLKLELARGRAQAVAFLPQPLGTDVKRAEQLRGAVVQVRGVWERTGESASAYRLLVPNVAAFETRRGPAPEADLPRATAADLARFRLDPIDTRLPVKVSGVVTLNQGGVQLYVQDDTGVVHVYLADPAALVTGQRVVAVGFPRAAGTTVLPRVDSARLVSREPAVAPADDLSLPPPVEARAADAAAGKFEGRVVRLVGSVHATGKQGAWQTLTVLADDLAFTVVMVGTVAGVEPGSTVEVVGVVTRQQFDSFPRHTFAVVTRPTNLKVLAGPPRPPEPDPAPPAAWWTGRRVAYLAAGFCGLFLFGGATVTALRVQVRRAAALARRQSEANEKLEGQLQVAGQFEAVGRVAGGVAHDFNNILTVINGCAQLLDEEITTDPTHAAVLAGDIRRAGRLAAAITRLLLSFSRQRPGAPQPLDVNATIADAAPTLSRLLGPNATLGVVPDPDLSPVLAQTGPFLQILINLTVNAGEAMPDGGAFTLVTSAAEPGWVRLTATDTGAGMTEEVRARAFDRGFTTKPTGTGTGLSTVSDVVRALGGRLRVRSAVGRGTAFEVDLPAAGVPLVPGPAPARGAPVRQDTAAPVGRSAPVVLVVEDDEAVGAFVRHVLEQIGLTVLSAADPERALRLLTDHAGPVDLLVTDITLPGLSGRELADRARAARPDLHVLFISGSTPEDADEPADFLRKPFGPSELADRVWHLLGRPAAG